MGGDGPRRGLEFSQTPHPVFSLTGSRAEKRHGRNDCSELDMATRKASQARDSEIRQREESRESQTGRGNRAERSPQFGHQNSQKEIEITEAIVILAPEAPGSKAYEAVAPGRPPGLPTRRRRAAHVS